MADIDRPRELDLRDYIGIIGRRRRLIAYVVAVVVGLTLAISFVQTPVYSARAEILLTPRASVYNNDTGNRSDPIRAQQTELAILRSQPVRDAVKSQLGVAPEVSVEAVGLTDLMAVIAESTVAARAAEVANAYASAYITYRQQQAVQDLLDVGKALQFSISELQKLIDGAPNGTDRDVLIQQQVLLKQRLEQVKVDSAIKSGGAQLVSRAATPASPVRPDLRGNLTLAIILGSLLGIAVAFLVDYLDDSIKQKEDVERVAPNLSVLGLVPAVAGWRPDGRPRVVSLTDPQSPAAEAYRTLRTSIQFAALDRPVQTLQVTSASVQEGKTTTLANLAIAMARAGLEVVVVCCDLRRPRIHEFFGLSNEMGFTSVLLGKTPLSSAVQKVPGQSRLSLLASGPTPPNPSELLSSPRTLEVITSLKSSADMVLIDSPPALPVTDALVLSHHVDATLLVSLARATTRKDLGRAVELLNQVDASILGVVLNGVKGGDGYASYYGYDGPPPSSATRDRRPRRGPRQARPKAPTH